MSINSVSSNSTNPLELNTETYESFKKQYGEYKSEWESISKSDGTDINTYLSEIKEKIEGLLNLLDKVVEDGYDEEIVKEAMQALGTLLKGSNTMMPLKVRLECLEMLLNAEKDQKILGNDYDEILGKLNDPDKGYSKEDFNKDYNIACDKKHYTDLIKDIDPNKVLTGKESLETLKEIYKEVITKKINEDLEKSESFLNEAKGKAATTSASLTLKIIQANHQFKELELENISDDKKEQDAQKNPMIKKLKDEGIWGENAVDRHLEMIKEERINEQKNTNRK